jgi:methylenetetrahydrofolate reductase (NADPH)
MATAPTPPRVYSGAWQKKPLRHLLEESDTFVHIVELVTSRGLITERDGRRVLALARRLTELPDVHALSITDNPGGNAMINPDTLGTDLLARGQEVIIHISCKDWNRNALQGRAWQLASEGFDNILALSGDYPISGYKGRAGGVFDIDSVGLLRMFADLNTGLRVQTGKKTRRLERTNFFLGTAVNNHKRYEREVMPQYFKLAKKIADGAAFVISQIGYDARKQDELLKYMAAHQLQASVIANVYVLSAPAARYFHGGNIPGVEVTDALMEEVEKQAKSPDKGKAYFLELAARQCAIARGLGYRGAYLGGHLQYGEYQKVIELSQSYAADDWRDFARQLNYAYADEFYYFEADEATGLSSTEISRSYLASLEPEARRDQRAQLPLSYRFNRLAHDKVFVPNTGGYRLGQRLTASLVDKPKARRFLHTAEQVIKIIGFDCRDCGDCSLPDIAYLCPESQCVKNQRNGPCGGTRQGLCEVGDKECIWARAYDRLKAYDEEKTMLDRPAVLKDGALDGTSAWLNTFAGQDHHGKSAKEKEAAQKRATKKKTPSQAATQKKDLQ